MESRWVYNHPYVMCVVFDMLDFITIKIRFTKYKMKN